MSEYTPTIVQGERAYIDGLAGTSRTREESAGEYRRMIAEVERAAAARALEEAADADDRRADYLIDTMPDAFSGLTKERFQKREEAYELRRVANRLRARAAEIREKGRTNE